MQVISLYFNTYCLSRDDKIGPGPDKGLSRVGMMGRGPGVNMLRLSHPSGPAPLFPALLCASQGCLSTSQGCTGVSQGPK